MQPLRHPSLALPEPLRAAEEPSFTHYSVVVRLPDIARRVLAENKLPPEAAAAIQVLIDEIPSGKVRAVDMALSPDREAWAGWLAPYLGRDWLEIPWFFAEEYFYLRILEATGYFHAGPWHARDPYAAQKRLGLETTRAHQQTLAEQIAFALQRPPETFRDALGRLLLVDLWGNQNDLSMWPVGSSTSARAGGGGSSAASSFTAAASSNGNGKPQSSASEELVSAQEHILSNDLPAVLAYFDHLGLDARVDILLDNAGYELVTDLALADFLLTTGHAARVVLHAKCHPVFVSDALNKDIHDTLDFLCFLGTDAARAMAVRLRCCLLEERLILDQHPFWTSPLPAWDMPPDLQETLAGSSLLISKGDANYRRLLGDRHWPFETPFASAVDYFPFAVLALRTLKSEITVGIPPEQAPTGDPKWMINGRWGLVQFAAPRQFAPPKP